MAVHLVRLIAVLSILTAQIAPAVAASAGVRIIRDAEIETMIKTFAHPLLKAAGLKDLPHVYLVADRRFNAFVVENGSMFVNYGTILDVKTPNELKGIIAHEIGHIAGGHLAAIRQRADTAGTMIALATILGVGAAIAAGTSGGSEEMTGLATAFITASQSTGINALMAFRRSEENAADAAALRLLKATKQSGRGLVDVMKFLQTRETAGSSPYLRTHPLAADRVEHLEKAAKSSPYWNRTDSAADKERLALAQAKIAGFLDTQQTVLNRYPNSDKSLAARYARTISAYQAGAVTAAIPAMQRLVATRPRDPYFQELLGQMYFEAGQPENALGPLKTAVALAPGQSQIRLLYGQALLTAGGKTNLEEAVLQLTRAARESPKSSLGYQSLSRAYAAIGNRGAADLYAAEAALVSGNKGTALGLARKAKGELPQQSPMWLRADDILQIK